MPTARTDPVQKIYYRVELWARLGDGINWLSVVTFGLYAWLESIERPESTPVKLVFVVLVVISVLVGYWVRYGLQPAADEQRRKLLLSSSLGVRLTEATQSGYYNNPSPPSIHRLLLSLLENTYFYPRLLRAEVPRIVVFCLVSLFALFVAVRFGTAETVELLALLVLFADFGVSRLVRALWAIMRLDALHMQLVAFLYADHDEWQLTARAMDAAAAYEYTKGRCGMRSSEATFAKLNSRLTTQWNGYLAETLACAGARNKNR